MNELSRVHVIIEGIVQGVFYRAFTRDIAASLRLRGWVRNLPNGTVEAVFEGNKGSVQTAINRCYTGPPASSVSNIIVSWEQYRGEFDSFDIRY